MSGLTAYRGSSFYATVDLDNRLRIFSLGTSECLHQFTEPDSLQKNYTAMDWGEDFAERGQETPSKKKKRKRVEVSQEGQLGLVAIGNDSGDVIIWNINRGVISHRITFSQLSTSTKPSPVRTLRFDPLHPSHLYVFFADGRLSNFDCEEGELNFEFNHPTKPFLSFSVSSSLPVFALSSARSVSVYSNNLSMAEDASDVEKPFARLQKLPFQQGLTASDPVVFPRNLKAKKKKGKKSKKEEEGDDEEEEEEEDLFVAVLKERSLFFFSLMQKNKAPLSFSLPFFPSLRNGQNTPFSNGFFAFQKKGHLHVFLKDDQSSSIFQISYGIRSNDMQVKTLQESVGLRIAGQTPLDFILYNVSHILVAEGSLTSPSFSLYSLKSKRMNEEQQQEEEEAEKATKKQRTEREAGHDLLLQASENQEEEQGEEEEKTDADYIQKETIAEKRVAEAIGLRTAVGMRGPSIVADRIEAAEDIMTMKEKLKFLSHQIIQTAPSSSSSSSSSSKNARSDQVMLSASLSTPLQQALLTNDKTQLNVLLLNNPSRERIEQTLASFPLSLLPPLVEHITSMLTAASTASSSTSSFTLFQWVSVLIELHFSSILSSTALLRPFLPLLASFSSSSSSSSSQLHSLFSVKGKVDFILLSHQRKQQKTTSNDGRSVEALLASLTSAYLPITEQASRQDGASMSNGQKATSQRKQRQTMHFYEGDEEDEDMN